MYLTIGICSIYRKGTGYLYLKKTLQSIVEQTTLDEKQKTSILLFLSDFNGDRLGILWVQPMLWA